MIKNLVILTGAGISAESGINTFRGQGGLWENHPIEDVASIDGYGRNPKLVQEFYNQRRRQLQSPEVKPNLAHHSLFALEKSWPGSFLIVTQNVDDLHERAGSKKLLHMHGELLKVRCTESKNIFSWVMDVNDETRCECCSKNETLRPHVVWFGEMPLEMPRIFEALRNCDIFISVGTSGQVYPAAGFVRQVPSSSRKIEINMEDTAISESFNEHRIGRASVEVPKLVKEILEDKTCS